MRTTITLESDVAVRLRDLAHERGLSFKAVVNLVLRRGLDEPAPTARPFRVKATDMGLLPGIDLDKALSLAAQLEDEETIRKLERWK